MGGFPDTLCKSDLLYIHVDVTAYDAMHGQWADNGSYIAVGSGYIPRFRYTISYIWSRIALDISIIID